MIRVRSQKIISKLSKKSLQTNRVRNMVAVSAIALTTLLFTALFTITETMLYTSEQQTFRQVGGSFHGGFKNLTLEQKELLEQDDGIKESGSRLMLGRAAGEEFRKVHAEISYMDENYRKYGFCTPEYGREPQEGTKQIACDTRILKCLGIEPEIGRQVTMTYEIGGLNKEEITDTFVLSGWWEFDAASSASMAIVSKSYVDTVIMKHPVDFTDDANATGTWSLDVFFDSSRHIEQDLLQILDSHGYQAEDQMKENYIGIGVNWGYAAAQMSEKYDIEMIAGSAALVVLIVMTGYLIIYNIFQISVSGDIRFYGLLKTIGTTGKQIKRMIRRQGILLSVMGIPIGLVLGYCSGTILAPLIISSINDSKTYQVFRPGIFIGAAGFSLVTVLLSCAKPGRMASKVSPVEAVRYTDVSCRTKMKKRKSSRTNVIRMARANLGRNKKKTFLVVISLSLAVVLLQATYTFALGFDMDKFLEKWVVSDFILGDADYFQYHYQGSGEALPQEDIAAVEAEGGITESGRIYANRLGVMEYVTEDLYREYFRGTDPEMIEEMLAKEERDADGKVKINAAFYGMEEYPLSQLNVFEGDIADLYDPEKNAIAAVYMEDDYGAVIEGSQWAKVGDTVKVRYVYEWEYSDAKTGEIIPKEQVDVYEGELIAKEKEYQDVSYEVAACVTVKQAMGYRFYGDHQFVLNAQVYQRDRKSADVMSYLFNTEKENLSSMQSFLQNYTEHVNPVLDFESKSRYIEAFDGYRTMFLIVGTGLSFIIGLIGILNFFNAILTSISVRRREFAMLQSIGMTGKQLKRMLICEGLLYGIFAVACSAVLCAAFGYLIKAVVSGMFWFFTYRFTLLPVIVVIPVFAAFGILLPLFCYRSVAKQTIVERLRLGD